MCLRALVFTIGLDTMNKAARTAEEIKVMILTVSDSTTPSRRKTRYAAPVENPAQAKNSELLSPGARIRTISGASEDGVHPGEVVNGKCSLGVEEGGGSIACDFTVSDLSGAVSGDPVVAEVSAGVLLQEHRV